MVLFKFYRKLWETAQYMSFNAKGGCRKDVYESNGKELKSNGKKLNVLTNLNVF